MQPYNQPAFIAAPPQHKLDEQAEIERLTAEWLAKGNKVKVYGNTEQQAGSFNRTISDVAKKHAKAS